MDEGVGSELAEVEAGEREAKIVRGRRDANSPNVFSIHAAESQISPRSINRNKNKNVK